METQKKVDSGTIVFDADKANFGFKRMEQLFPVVQDEVKGYPCVAYDKYSDPIKFGIKVIPLELKYENETHPCRIEISLLKEFTKLVTSGVTPHITFFFKDMSVKNNKKALTRFPLKSLRKEIFKESNVLIAEYVPGGSIEEWIQEQPNILEKQWKYIIFSVAWTLLVLQNKYLFLQNDLHYGNILVDTSIDPTDKGCIEYELKRSDDDSNPIVFSIPNVGLLPKIWDFEFASTFDEKMSFHNEFFKETDDCIPHSFNPYYDLHCFLTSLLELDIPDRLRDFITDLYPEELLPPDMSDSETGSETGSDYTDDSDVTCSTCCDRYYKEEYYKTDESTRTTGTTRSTKSVTTGKSSQYAEDSDVVPHLVNDLVDDCGYEGDGERYDDDDGSDDSTSTTSTTTTSSTWSSSSRSSISSRSTDSTRYTRSSRSSRSSRSRKSYSSFTSEEEYRTEFMLGDRMLNGAEKKFDLPTPMDILMSDYFADYLKTGSARGKKVTSRFKYTMLPRQTEVGNSGENASDEVTAS